MTNYYSREEARDCQLYVNEKIIKKISYYCKDVKGGLYFYHYELTDFNRLIVSWDYTPSEIFPTSTYGAESYNLNDVNEQEISILNVNNGRIIFYKSWYEIILNVKMEEKIQKVKILCENNSSEVYKNLIDHMRKYGKNNTQANNSKSRVAELRELYEDGIITKEELVDLLKQ